MRYHNVSPQHRQQTIHSSLTMNHSLQTLHFFYALLKERYTKVDVSTQTLALENGTTIECDVYRPTNSKKIKASILFTHGLTQAANRDHRIVAAAKGFCTVGCQVFAPCYPLIQGLDISVKSVDDIEMSIQALLANNDAVNNKMGILSVSFSGVQAIYAASRPSIRSHISSILTIGTGNTYQETVHNAMGTHGKADCYIRLLLLRNLLLYSKSDYDPTLDKVLMKGLEIAYQHDEPERLEILEEELTPEQQLIYQSYLKNLYDSDEHLKQYKNVITQFDEDFYASGNFQQLLAAVTLIHSSKDTVIPASESIALHDRLQRVNVNCRLVITSLMDHVNHDISLKQIKQASALFKAFKFFFKTVG